MNPSEPEVRIGFITAPDAETAPLEEALRRAGASAIYRPTPCPGVRVERKP